MIDRCLNVDVPYFLDFVRTDPASARHLYQIAITRLALNRRLHDSGSRAPPPQGDLDLKFCSKYKSQISATQRVGPHCKR